MLFQETIINTNANGLYAAVSVAEIPAGIYKLFTVILYTLVAARVAERQVYVIVGHSVEVSLFTDAVEDITSDDSTPHVSNNVLILENVPSSMSDDVLMLYIDNITELDADQNDYSVDRNNDEVVVTFNATLDVHKFPAGMYVYSYPLRMYSEDFIICDWNKL